MSGCGKLLNHGSTVNTVVEDTGSEAPHSLPSDTLKSLALVPSNTSAPAPEPSNTAPPLSDSVASSSLIFWHGYVPTINVSNLVLYWTLNAVVYALALAVICVGTYRCFIPKIEDIYLVSETERLCTIHLASGRIPQHYRLCYYGCVDSTSSILCFFKKVTHLWCYRDAETYAQIKEEPFLISVDGGAPSCYYRSKPAMRPSK
jgi:hypothetical protein